MELIVASLGLVLLPLLYRKGKKVAAAEAGHKKEKKVEEAIERLKMKQEWDERKPFFYFIPRKELLEWEGDAQSKPEESVESHCLPRMQYLRDNEKLKKLSIPLGNAFRGEPWTDEDGTEHRIEDILFVSQRCVCFQCP